MVERAAHPVQAAVAEGVRQLVEAAVAAEQQRAARLSAQGNRWRTRGLTRAQAAAVRAAWRSEQRRLRAAGELLDVRDALVEYGVREELRVRGWDRAWDPAPEEAWDQGRWPGSRDRGLGGYPERVSARLEAALVAQTVAACWWTSWPAIQALRAWRDANPGLTPPRYRLGEEDLKHVGGPLAAYERLAVGVTTTGEIWRAGITRGLERAAALTR
ncbi:hypothetical protein ACIG3E_32445 [Streptomyces sp. NPDC053474]|uniref:hypothetical protein n=1 Tax=Streptomyces sp. NPDC053474 TaxID=3365704 RepID=UPI0037D7F4E1